MRAARATSRAPQKILTTPAPAGWVDTLFMGLASMIQYSARTGDPRFTATALSEYHDTTHGGRNASQPGLWDPESNLYWRECVFFFTRVPRPKTRAPQSKPPKRPNLP